MKDRTMSFRHHQHELKKNQNLKKHIIIQNFLTILNMILELKLNKK